jgi:PAS domain S-box-containing protein
MNKNPKTYEELLKELGELRIENESLRSISEKDNKKNKQVEVILLESEERFRLLFEKAPLSYQSLDINGNFIDVNKAWSDTLGYTQEEVKGKWFGDFLVPKFKDAFRERFPLFKAQGKIHSEFEMVHKNGNKLFVAFDGRIGTDSEGNFKQTYCILKDISEQRKTEKLLRESEELFRHSFDYAAIGICIVGIDKKFQRVNNAFIEMTGYANDDIINLTFTDITHPEDQSIGLDQFKQMIDGEIDKASIVKRYIRKDKQVIWVSMSISLIRSIDQQPQFFITQIIDITERERMVEDLLKFSRAVEQSPVSIITTDTSGNIEYVNPKLIEITGYQFAEVHGKNPKIFSSGEKSKSEYKVLWDTILSGNEWHGEMHNKKKNGNLYWELASISPIINERGEITHFLAIKEDITERKRVEIELITAKEKAEESNRLKDAFIANISHEIRTPLNGILGMSSLIREIFHDNIKKEDEELFEGIDYSSKRIIRTVDMILNYSRLQVGEFPIIQKNLELSSICKRLVIEFTSAAKNKSLDLTFHNNCEKSEVFADEYSITMVISNLIDNAIKFTNKGYIEVILKKGTDDKIILEVKDTGIGIDKKYLDYMFEPYRQEQMGYGRAYDGIGLGLSIVKKVLSLNNAIINVESKKGEGTTFSINFSNEKQPLENKIETRTTANIFPAPEDTRKELVLIVEDEIVNQTTIKRFIEKRYLTIITDSSDEALEILHKNKVDLILMDISISGSKNGLELTKELKESKEFSNIPVIAVTAHAFLEDRQKALEAGCDGYLAKPFSKESLLNMMAVYSND